MFQLAAIERQIFTDGIAFNELLDQVSKNNAADWVDILRMTLTKSIQR